MTVDKLSQRLRSQGQAFLFWWFRTLLGLVPVRMRHWYMETFDLACITISNDSVLVSRPHNGSFVPLARRTVPTFADANERATWERAIGRYRRQGFVLVVPDGHLLRREIVLPAAIEPDLRRAMSFEIDRRTPFKDDQVYFDCRILRRNEADASLVVELTVVPKTLADSLLLASKDYGLPITGLSLGSDLLLVGKSAPNLLPESKRYRSRSFRQLAGLILLGATVAISVLAAVIPIRQRAVQWQYLEAQAQHYKQLATQVERERETLGKSVRDHNFLPALKQSSLPVFELLERLTLLLNDETWIYVLELTGRDTLEITGESDSAAKLLGRISEAPFVKEASFKAPVTKSQFSNYERFQIRMITKPVAPEPQAAQETASPAPPVLPDTEQKP
jgi:general secretion pathway protein L